MPTPYEQYLASNVNALERLGDKFSGLDERLDYLVKTIEAALQQLAAAQAPEPDIRLDTIIGRFDTLIAVMRGTPLPTPTPAQESHLPLEWGRATGGGLDRLIDGTKNWGPDVFAGWEITIVAGAGGGQTRIIKTNDRTSIIPITPPGASNPWDSAPNNTSTYVIRADRGQIGNRAALTTGQKDVTTAGTAEQMPDVKIPNGFRAVILAKPGNTGYIYFGNSKANAESSTNRFDRLEPGDSIPVCLTNLNLLWLDCSVSGEGVSYYVEQNS